MTLKRKKVLILMNWLENGSQIQKQDILECECFNAGKEIINYNIF